MTQEANMNRQHFVFEKSIRLNVANETRNNRTVTVKWQVRDASARVLEAHETVLEVPALSSVWMDKVELPDLDVFTEYVSFQAYDGDSILSEGTVIFSYPKYFRYQNPELSYTLEGDWITVHANAYAKSIEIQNENEDLVLSDNYFDLNGGSKRVHIERGTPDGIRLQSVYDIR